MFINLKKSEICPLERFLNGLSGCFLTINVLLFVKFNFNPLTPGIHEKAIHTGINLQLKTKGLLKYI